MRDFREFWLIVVLVLVCFVGYRAGQAHKRDCIARGEVGCSILPWSGSIPGQGPGTSSGLGTGPAVAAGIHDVGASDSSGISAP